MQTLSQMDIKVVSGGFPVTEGSLEAVFGSLWNSPATLALRTPPGLGAVMTVAELAWKIGTEINNYFGQDIADLLDRLFPPGGDNTGSAGSGNDAPSGDPYNPDAILSWGGDWDDFIFPDRIDRIYEVNEV